MKAGPASREVSIDEWLPERGGVGHLFGRDDEALTSYALEIVRHAQDRGGRVLWISTGGSPTDWLMEAKSIRPDHVRLIWDRDEVEPLVDGAMADEISLIIWEKPFAAAPPLDIAIDDFVTRCSWASSVELNRLLPRLRRLLRPTGAALVLVNKASRRPRENLYQPNFGGVIKRAGAPFLTAYLTSRRNPDHVPERATEGESLRLRLKDVTAPALRLSVYELRHGIVGEA